MAHWVRGPVVAFALLAAVSVSGCGDDGDTGASAPDTVARSTPTPSVSDPIARSFKDGATPLVRTDFSDDAAWNRIVSEAKAGDTSAPGEDGYVPNVVPIEDRRLAGVTAQGFAARWKGRQSSAGYLLLADATAMDEAAAGKPVTLVYEDLTVTPADAAEFGWTYGRTFRCALNQVSSTEANLSLANMDFSDFADDADRHGGVFTGFH